VPADLIGTRICRPDRGTFDTALGPVFANFLLADATRRPAEHGIGDVARLVEFGASPRGPIGLVQAARVLALLRGRGHVTPSDIRDLAGDVLRHRIVLSYDALSEGVSADDILERVLEAVPAPADDHIRWVA